MTAGELRHCALKARSPFLCMCVTLTLMRRSSECKLQRYFSSGITLTQVLGLEL